ncbi:MAG: hypothetical protein Q4D35_01165 [Ruminococcus sp.]|nr:hypothetical protein [Ruminococcus sp.]
MYTCKPAKRSIVFIYVSILLIAMLITQLVLTFDSFLKELGNYILIILWAIVGIYLLILFPLFYKKTRFMVSKDDIVKYTFLFTFKYQYMTMDSVRSVSTIITPLSRVTGLNFIIINALGSKMLLPFILKDDCLEITKYFNEIISNRHKTADNASKE